MDEKKNKRHSLNFSSSYCLPSTSTSSSTSLPLSSSSSTTATTITASALNQQKRYSYRSVHRKASCLAIIFILISIISFSTVSAEKSVTSQQRSRPPKIKEHPTSMIVSKHEPVTLNCKADGFPPPNIEWYKDGRKVEKSPHRMILDGSLFFLHVVSKKGDENDIGTYYCIAKNEFGSDKSRNATLEVAFLKDEFRKMPISTRVALGKTIQMQCIPPRGRPEPTVTWIHNNKTIKIDNLRYRLDGTNLIINDVMKHDEGQYQCNAKNQNGERYSSPATLKILIEPFFINPPENNQVMADTDVVFTCQVGGDPQPKISWRKLEDALAMDKAQILEDKSLKLRQVKASDEGTYVCLAENAAGKISRSAFLKVISRPNLIASPKNVQIMANSIAKMDCMATGNPEPIYFWFKESTHLLMFPGQTYGRFNVTKDGQLTIANVATEDQGFYVCTAISNVGSTLARAYLKVFSNDDVPPPVISFGATNQTLPLNTKAFLPCEAFQPSSPLTTSSPVTVQWLYNEVPIHNDNHFTITNFGLQIQDIQRQDSGIYTCLASSSSGSTRWNAKLLVESPRNPNIKFSKMQTAEMFPEAPSKPIIVNVSETTVTIKWQRTGSSAILPHLGCLIDSFSPDLKNGWNTVANRISTDIYTIEDLKPNTRYMFYVRAQNINGLGFPSEISDEVRTLNPNSKPNDELNILQARNTLNNINLQLRDTRAISSTSIKLFWSILTGNTDFIEGFYIRYQETSINGLSTAKFNMVTVFGGATNSYTLNDLKKYTTYRMFVMPFYRNIEGMASNMLEERTLEDVPSEPPNSITAKAINTSCALIEWLPPSKHNQNGVILGYNLLIYENKTYLFTNLTLDSKTNSIVIDLTTGSIYSIKISAFTSIGNGPFSPLKSLFMDSNLIDAYSTETNREKSDKTNIFSQYFWFCLSGAIFIVLFILILFILISICCNRKNKSIYEKETSLTTENFSDNFHKFDSNSSKYSSCPDNGEYAEVNDFKHYNLPSQQQDCDMQPYAMTPLIEKTANHHPHHHQTKQLFYKPANLPINNKNDSIATECLLLNGHKQQEMAHLNNHHTRLNILDQTYDEIEDNLSYNAKKLNGNLMKQQNSSPTVRSNFNCTREPSSNVILLNTVSNNGKNNNRDASSRVDGRSLMTFHHNSHHQTPTSSPSQLHIGTATPRIITNPLSSSYETSHSDSSSSQKNFQSHYYASSEINKMPFTSSLNGDSTSSSRNSSQQRIGSSSSHCDNDNNIVHDPIRRQNNNKISFNGNNQSHISIRNRNEFY